ncbi:MAG: hypothetical protein HQ494_12425 [Rhodospirillales bacterium]|nr:hypothetical protein [Rhodospirillales bacterium]
MTDTTYTASLSGHSEQTVSEALRTLVRLAVNKTLSLPGHALQILIVWQKRTEARTQLAGMEYHLRQDLGLTRTDIRAETKKPFWTA